MFDNKGVTEKYVPFVAPYIAPEGFTPDFIVSVDTADTGLIPKYFTGEINLSIDHHGTNSFYAKQTYVEPHKASCGEILLEIIKELCGGIDKEEATLLYMAISTDTGCFVYANTKADTHEAAAETISAGAEMARINKLMFRSVRRQRIMLEALAYSGLRSYMNNKINIEGGVLMIDIKTACDIALKHMPGYILCGASELHDGFLFSFSTKDGEEPDIDPMLVSKETGEIIMYDFFERSEEIFFAKTIDLTKI
jgi:phosphoesterase RecJ-like protein